MGRFPLPALCACASCAVLLVGCQSPVAPVPPPPPVQQAQSLSFEIAGPSQIDTNGLVTWEVFAFGGSGEYQYLWEVTGQAGQQIITTATERKLSLLITQADGDMSVKVTVTSGNQTRAESFDVRNCIVGC